MKEDSNPVYEAPEVLRNAYTEKCDIWSLGCVLYFLVSGYLPFWGNYNHEVIEKILKGNYDLEEADIWYFVSEDVKDLIRSMLEYDPNRRISAVQALRHPWFDCLKKGNTKPSKDLGRSL